MIAQRPCAPKRPVARQAARLEVLAPNHCFLALCAARATDFEGGARTIMTNRNFSQHWAAKGLPPDWDFRIHETHSDAVTKMPQQAQLLGSSKVTDVEVISQGDWFLGLQVKGGTPRLSVQQVVWLAGALTVSPAPGQLQVSLSMATQS